MIIRSSDYIQEQLIVPEDPAQFAAQKEKYKNLPFKVYIII